MTSDIIRVHDVSKQFRLRNDKSLKERLVNRRSSREHENSFWALRNIDLDIQSGSTIGFVGHNGSGKSTLLKVIGGILTPTSGYVERRGRLAALLELGAGFHGDLTGRENVFLNASLLGLTRKQTEQYFDAIVDFSGIEEFIDTQVKFYSSGMYVRLAFAVAVHVDPEILLVDEVLAVGDEPFQRKCLERIRRFQSEGRTIVLVTHALDQVRELCDRAVMLDHGHMVAQGSAVEVIRAFRDANDDAAAELAPNATDRPVSITSLSVTAPDGSPLVTVGPDQPVTFRIGLEARERVEDYVVGIALTDHMERLVYGTNTHMLDVATPSVDGPLEVAFAVDRLPVVEGQYYVTAAVHPRRGPEWHRVDRAAVVRVRTTVSEDGVVHLAPRFEVVA
ncbi:ABC transporter ATP-binding protein [Cellulomonas fimi]|uniref:ABC transporter ATP-binding protein n=1 Tax=Cellulomonas fimi TaxID=1708 RepID=UPI00234C1687|nr:ABC transporter ATP-binding protein [Cellulomonas fimi]MDC7122971.1 ABC transporter ATP-binding protein [Cellulomonas fimi]